MTKWCSTWISMWLYRGRGKLPGVLMPNRYRARFRPVAFGTEKLRTAIGEHERFTYDEAWRQIAETKAAPEQTARAEAPAPPTAERAPA